MDIQPLIPWIVAVNTIVTLGTVVFSLLTSGAKKTASDLETHKAGNAIAFGKIDTALDDQDKRVQTLESEFRHLPDKEIVHRLELTMKDMQVQMAGMAASSEATARTARRVEEFLLDQAKSS